MFLFLFLVFPGLITFFCYENKNIKECVIPIIWGVLGGCLTCLFDVFFVFSSNTYLFSFVSNYVWILLHTAIFPLVVTGVIVFLVLKDSVFVKIKALFPFWCAFYAIYIPFNCISGKTEYSLFELFAKPMLYSAMLVFLYVFAENLCTVLKEANVAIKRKKISLIVIFVILAILLPAVIETLWFMGYSWILWLLCFVVYLLLSILVYLKNKKKIIED